MAEFWRSNWYFGAIFVIVLLVVNALFLSQWKMLSCLEREDWPALARLLEGRIIGKKRFTKRSVRLYCDSLILLSDFDGLKKLSAALESGKPALFARLSPRFAAAAILSGEYDAAYRIATTQVSGVDREGGEWRAFYAAFSRHLARKPDEAAEGMLALARGARDPIVAVLSGYLCQGVLARSLEGRTEELSAAASEAQLRVGAVFTHDRWMRYVEEAKADMQVVILGKLISEATAWLFPQNK